MTNKNKSVSPDISADTALMIFANTVHNKKLSDKKFREFTANTLMLFERPNEIMIEKQARSSS